jgi:prepilin peptidase CpaA
MDIFFLVLTVLMVLVIYFDATRYLIPNWLVGLMLAFYPAMVLLSPATINWMGAAGIMLGVFVLGYGIFAMRWMGGGDIKLLTVCALWAGPERIMDFLLITAILGGALGLVLIVVRKYIPMALPKLAGKLPRILQPDQPLPYGLAIAAAFLHLLWKQQLPGLSM